jgi:mannosyl-3-phosphoglycerate phosphatase
MFVIFTDLDGTLLDHADYSWEAARPAILKLRRLNIPWPFVTSKTRAETLYWRKATANTHPFVIENGGAAYVPPFYFPAFFEWSGHRGLFSILEWGVAHGLLVEALEQAERQSRARIRAFHQMSVSEVAEACGMDVAMAALAKAREYDEPFEVLESGTTTALTGAIRRAGLRCTKGGRFWHITGRFDKGNSVRSLTRLYAETHGPVTTAALGDSLNDLEMLKSVDIPMLIPSAQTHLLQNELPGAWVASAPGPEGWNEAVLRLLNG